MAKPIPAELKKFSLKRYEPCANWSAEDWLKALSARSLLRLYIYGRKDKNVAEPRLAMISAMLPTHREMLLKKAEERLMDPLIDLTEYQVMPKVFRPLAVRDFLSSDLYFLNQSMGEFIGLELQDIVVRSLPKADPSNEPVFLAVNLCHPDKLIIEEFSHWLQSVRAKTGIKAAEENENFLTEEDFREWHRRHLLAYIDIAVWAKLARVSLSNAQIGELLYPNLDGTDKRMETNAKHALQLISKHNLYALTRLVIRQRVMS